MLCWTVQDLKGFRNGAARDFGSTRQPFLVLEMSELFRHSDIDELVERDAFLLRAASAKVRRAILNVLKIPFRVFSSMSAGG
jgi:hypothetical protein